MPGAQARLGLALGASMALHGMVLIWTPALDGCGGAACGDDSLFQPLSVALAKPATGAGRDAPPPAVAPPSESDPMNPASGHPAPPRPKPPQVAGAAPAVINAPAERAVPANAAAAATTPAVKADAESAPDRAEAAFVSAPSARADTQAVARLEHLVHAAVEAQKRYPLAARHQGREGRARIGFRLFPDGRLDGLTVLDTSGSGVLDRAALAAVRGIEPFREAGDYLREARSMQVEILFRLN